MLTIKYFEEPVISDLELKSISSREELDSVLTTEISKQQTRGRKCLKVYYEETGGIVLVKRYDTHDFPTEQLWTRHFGKKPAWQDEDDDCDEGFWMETILCKYREIRSSGKLSSLIIDVDAFAGSSPLSQENEEYVKTDIARAVCTFKDDKVTARFLSADAFLCSQVIYIRSDSMLGSQFGIFPFEENFDVILADMGFSPLKKEKYDINGDVESRTVWTSDDRGKWIKKENCEWGIWEDHLSSYQVFSYDSEGKLSGSKRYARKKR